MLLHVVATAHSFYATLAVYDTLFAGVEGMALAAQLHAHGGLGGSGVKHVAARAGYD